MSERPNNRPTDRPSDVVLSWCVRVCVCVCVSLHADRPTEVVEPSFADRARETASVREPERERARATCDDRRCCVRIVQ